MLDSNPGDHCGIVGAERQGWREEGESRRIRYVLQRFPNGLIGGNTAGNGNDGGLECAHFQHGAAGFLGKNIGRGGLETGADVGANLGRDGVAK